MNNVREGWQRPPSPHPPADFLPTRLQGQQRAPARPFAAWTPRPPRSRWSWAQGGLSPARAAAPPAATPQRLLFVWPAGLQTSEPCSFFWSFSWDLAVCRRASVSPAAGSPPSPGFWRDLAWGLDLFGPGSGLRPHPAPRPPRPFSPCPLLQGLQPKRQRASVRSENHSLLWSGFLVCIKWTKMKYAAFSTFKTLML